MKVSDLVLGITLMVLSICLGFGLGILTFMVHWAIGVIGFTILIISLLIVRGANKHANDKSKREN